jgi:hypothetical protein
MGLFFPHPLLWGPIGCLYSLPFMSIKLMQKGHVFKSMDQHILYQETYYI